VQHRMLVRRARATGSIGRAHNTHDSKTRGRIANSSSSSSSSSSSFSVRQPLGDGVVAQECGVAGRTLRGRHLLPVLEEKAMGITPFVGNS